MDAGASVVLHVHPDNRFWDPLRGEQVDLRLARSEGELPSTPGELFIVHTKISERKASELAAAGPLLGFSHLPMYQRQPEWLSQCTLVATVSEYCLGLLRQAGVTRLYPEPMYGIADVARGDPQAQVVAASPYLWDRRKARDRFLGFVESFKTQKHIPFAKRPGLTLGLVSLITPIKQFPLLFSHLAPVLARHDVNLEVFGAGGYAQVRDLRAQLRPIEARTRFWGYQENVAAVYPRIDYLLAGLPEKEALGLNVLEAQRCGTPVLAPKAPPFTETVLDGGTGYLYRDPREDGGAAFDQLLGTLKEKSLDPRRETAHLERFSYPAFANRARRLLEAIMAHAR